METAEGGLRLSVAARLVTEDLRVGDSVAVSGVCLTVVERGERRFAADVVPETLRVTTLGERRVGDAVNLERPLALGARLGGHLVQGHVDGVITMLERAERADGLDLLFTLPLSLSGFVVPKGSVGVDGVSLTVAAKSGPDRFAVAIIPHTAAVTTLGRLRVGGRANIEVDVLAKYVGELVRPYGQVTPGGAA